MLLMNVAASPSIITQLGECFANVLADNVQVDAGELTRKAGSNRAYNAANRKRKAEAPVKVYKELASIDSLVDGSAFDPSSDPSQDANPSANMEDSNEHTCCSMRCNEQWSVEKLQRTRAQLPRYGPGTQATRKKKLRPRKLHPGRSSPVHPRGHRHPSCMLGLLSTAAWRFTQPPVKRSICRPGHNVSENNDDHVAQASTRLYSVIFLRSVTGPTYTSWFV